MVDPRFDPAQLLASLLKGGKEQAEGAEAEAAGEASAAPAAASMPDPAASLAALAHRMADLQQQFFTQMTAFWTGAPSAPGSAPKETDNRVASDAWRGDPRVDLLRQG